MSRQTAYAGDEQGGGWITFAGIMMFVVATLNIIDGIAAISKSSFFVGDAKYIVFDSLNSWGWIILCLGVIQVLVAFGIWAGNQLAPGSASSSCRST